MVHDRPALVRLFADLQFAPYGVSDWKGDVGVASWTTDARGGVESITLAYGRGEDTLVEVTTSRGALEWTGLLGVEALGRFELGLSVSGRVSRFTAVGADGTWAALRESDGRGPSVVVAARDVKPTEIRLERVARSQPYIDGFVAD